ncbi:PREDICTED: acidic phospholipase A2 PLA-1-like [Branchiostoma belcheri]|uniref:Phospholipase A2 n=1 Tax=Branchiostoma belcheri TaxID=7741 RepID=A0A6P5AKU6_BRABE|nr:PREDICTED: acidic phospholipase A2 PLA-1-like [Branchiostoma belcheri]
MPQPMSQPVDQLADADQPKSRAKRDLFSLSGVIRCVTGNSALLMYNNYGCFCGRGGGRGRPVDDIDRCCVAHDRCYALPTWFNALFVIYPYRCIGNSVVCTSRNWLRRSVCECDKALAECFARSVYNRRFKNYPYCGVLQPEDPAVDTGKHPAVDAGKHPAVDAGKKPTVKPGKDEKPWVGSGDGYDRFIN